MAPSRPIAHEPLSWETQTPQKQPISIMPSRPMLMTPERSEKSPPSAPNVSGVANWNAPTNSPVETIAATEVLCVRHTTTSTHERRERGQADLRPLRHAGSTPGGGAAAEGGDGPAVVVGISARSRLARATSQRTTSSPPTSRMIVPWMMVETRPRARG